MPGGAGEGIASISFAGESEDGQTASAGFADIDVERHGDKYKLRFEVNRPPEWDHSSKVTTAQEAGAVVMHQQEYHCPGYDNQRRRHLIEVECDDAGKVWRCDYRTTRGSGETEIEKSFQGGEDPDC